VRNTRPAYAPAADDRYADCALRDGSSARLAEVYLRQGDLSILREPTRRRGPRVDEASFGSAKSAKTPRSCPVACEIWVFFGGTRPRRPKENLLRIRGIEASRSRAAGRTARRARLRDRARDQPDVRLTGHPQRGVSSGLMPSNVFPTISWVSIELAGWIRPR